MNKASMNANINFFSLPLLLSYFRSLEGNFPFAFPRNVYPKARAWGDISRKSFPCPFPNLENNHFTMYLTFGLKGPWAPYCLQRANKMRGRGWVGRTPLSQCWDDHLNWLTNQGYGWGENNFSIWCNRRLVNGRKNKRLLIKCDNPD